MAEEQEEKILYDILVPEEWPDSVSILNEPGHNSLLKMMGVMLKGCKWFALELIRNPSMLFGVPFSYSSILTNVINSRLSWQLAITRDGGCLAIARDDCIEIRLISDEFENVKIKLEIDKDPQPQWRKMAWNRRGNTLVYTNSLGEVYVTVFTVTNEVVSIKKTHKLIDFVGRVPATTSEGTLFNMAVSGLLFINEPKEVGGAKSKQNGADEGKEFLVVIGYSGLVTTFQPDINRGYIKLHSVSLLSYFPCGIGAAEYIHSHNLMVLAGWSDGEQESAPLVSCWQLANDQPYWRPPPGHEVQKRRTGTFKQLMAKRTPNSSSLFAVCVSPDEQSIAGISLSGSLTVWDLPSCRLRKEWSLDELTSSSEITASGNKPLKGPITPIEVQWWSNEALIVVNSLHNVTIPTVRTLSNLLGQYAEPGAAITSAHNGQFLMLECNSREVWTNRDRLLPSLSDIEDSDIEDNKETTQQDTDNTGISLKAKMSTVMKRLLYFLTEMDKFKPPSRKLKKLIHHYSLVCLKSMLPEECYERKMRNEEYGEALALAKRYDLDCDLVYQHQWQRCTDVTKSAIIDYLSRVTKKTWVIQECLHCVAKDFLTMKELLLFGLRSTEFNEIMIVDDDKMEDMNQSDDDKVVPSGRIAAELITKNGSLSEDQIFLCQCRESLLQYLERLNTYEIILGGPAATFELYNSQFFKKFRERNLVRAAMDYAQDGNYCAVEALFSRHGDVVLSHRLAILATFPETLDPKKYKYLLPKIDDEDNMEEWREEINKEKDWVEYPSVRKLYCFNRQTSFGDFIYEENPDLKKYLKSPVSHDLLRVWYSERATEIEEYSGQVDNALAIVKIGMDHGIKDLETLHYHLQTLYTLIYHCCVDIRLSLSQVQRLSHLELVQLMMKDVDERDFVIHFNRYCIPYVSRLRTIDPAASLKLLEEFMVIVSKNDLRPCADFLKTVKQSSGQRSSGPFSLTAEQTINIGLRCILACERNDQLKEADAIFECFPAETSSTSLQSLHHEVDRLENYLFAAEIMKKYGVMKPVHFFKDIQENATEAEKMIVRVTRVASQKTPPLSENGWRLLLSDIVTLRSRVFRVLTQKLCYKIFAQSMLCSGDVTIIKLTSQIIQTSSKSRSPSAIEGLEYTIPRDTSIGVIVTAVREYINSSTSPHDKEIELAKLCASLVEEYSIPVDLMSELNLIQALEVLEDFNINILPINVRLCDNKLDIIRQVLDSAPSAYKRYEKILQLSYLLGHSTESDELYTIDELLGVPSLSEGKGYTIVVLSLTAIQYGDYKLAQELCDVLMRTRFEHAWEVCKQLGSDDKFPNNESRLQLLNFSLCYCPVEEIQVTLKEKRILDTKLQLEECNYLNEIEKSSLRQLMGRGSNTLQHIVSQGASQISKYHKQPVIEPPRIYGQSHREILNKCVNALREIAEERRGQKEQRHDSLSMAALSYHPFYTNLTVKHGTYSSWRESIHTADVILHQTILSLGNNWMDSWGDQDVRHQLPELVQSSLGSLVSCLFSTDTHFTISCLLSMKAEAFGSLCETIPKSCKLSHQLILYAVCLKLYNQFTKLNDSRYHPFNHNPAQLIDHVIGCVDQLNQLDEDNPFVKHLIKCNESLIVYLEVQTLRNLNQNIDVDLFVVEENYRKQSILRLARQKDPDMFQIAVYFTGRYKVSKWEVCLTQLNWLLTQSGLSADGINQRVSQLKLMGTLLTQPQKLADELVDKVYNRLPSTRYSLLYQYYTFLQWTIEKGAKVSGAVSVQIHLKLLKSFQKSLRGANYHVIMSGADPLSELVPSLQDHNVHVVAELASDIPIEGGQYLSPDMVYAAFVIKKFRQDKVTSDTDELRARLKECREYISLLDPDQFRRVVGEIIFSTTSLQQMTMDNRVSLLNIFIDISSRRIAGESKSPNSFKKLTSEFNLYKKHIDSLNQSTLLSTPPLEVDKGTWKGMIEEYDLSLAATDKVSVLAQRMCGIGIAVTTIDTLLNLANGIREHTLTVKDIIQQTLTDSLSNTNDRDAHSYSPIERIMISVAKYEKESDPNKPMLCSSLNVLDILRPICSSPTQSPELKRTLLHLMNKHLPLSQENLSLLLAYQTQSIISDDFADVEVSIDQVLTKDGQLKLFSNLLQQSTSLHQLDTLASLLLSWPTNTSGGNPLLKCWVDLITATAGHNESGCGSKAVSMRCRLEGVSLEDDQNIISILFKKDKRSALQLALVSPHHVLLKDILKKISSDELPLIADQATMELILNDKRIPSKIITTPLYELMFGYLVDSATVDDLKNSLESTSVDNTAATDGESIATVTPPSKVVVQTAKLLHEDGLVIEAGSMMLLAQGTHVTVSNMSSAFFKLLHS